jgi:hypothetical protein
MDAVSLREASIDGLIPRLLAGVTSILFRAVAKMICPMPEKKAADVARIDSQRRAAG